MKERPILFSAPMVLAILAGRKTQTRRIVKVPGGVDPGHWHPQRSYEKPDRFVALHWPGDHGECQPLPCPYGQPGDRLWVRETWCLARPGTWDAPKRIDPQTGDAAYFAAGWERSPPSRWRPSIFMPRWASRLTLEVESVRVERLQDISEEDAKAEGVEPFTSIGPDQRLAGDLQHGRDRTQATHPHTIALASLWDSINGDRANWASNPWVWVVGFRRIRSALDGGE